MEKKIPKPDIHKKALMICTGKDTTHGSHHAMRVGLCGSEQKRPVNAETGSWMMGGAYEVVRHLAHTSKLETGSRRLR